MPYASETISFEDLAKHNDRKSLWIAVHGSVYDLTTFVSDHPGGIEALGTCAGTDGTESFEYAQHSKASMKKMQQFRVGRLAGSLEETAPSLLGMASKAVESGNSMAPASSPHLSDFPRLMKLAVVTVMVSLVLALLYLQRGFLTGHIASTLRLAQLQSGVSLDQSTGNAFWAGMAVASSVSCLGYRYLYKTFKSTLNYENEVFSFPATIPRRR